MSDHKKRRLDLLCRLRELHVEQARADHVVAQTELDKRREAADDTERRLQVLDEWAVGQLSVGAPLVPEILRHAQLFRGVEKKTLEQQRGEQEQSQQRTAAAHDELRERFEQLSVVERLATRHAADVSVDLNRRAAVTLDEAGMQRKNLESQE
ncbi:MAG TPA: hypothetical protein VGO61_22780 [Steroidobacteraceae bacterium]|jgi:hypothetical protein|nr:hypothetical protein [Steroidobacteraceae bacterium]